MVVPWIGFPLNDMLKRFKPIQKQSLSNLPLFIIRGHGWSAFQRFRLALCGGSAHG